MNPERRTESAADIDRVLVEHAKSVSELLRFAETKSTTLVVGNMLFAAFLSRESAHSMVFSASMFLALTSCIVCWFSILPKLLRDSMSTGRAAPDAAQNPLFFGATAHFEPKQWLQAVFPNSAEFEARHFFLADQIIKNSEIASRKFRLSTIALMITALAVVLVMAAVSFATLSKFLM